MALAGIYASGSRLNRRIRAVLKSKGEAQNTECIAKMKYGQMSRDLLFTNLLWGQFLCNLPTFHPYWSPVGGTITIWSTPYGVITLSQCNTWICEPILKCPWAKEVCYSAYIHFLRHSRIFTPYVGSVGGFNTTLRVPYWAISLS